MVLSFWEYYVDVHNPLSKSYKILEKEKYTSHTIACLTVFMCVFCYTCVKNLLEGPELCSLYQGDIIHIIEELILLAG